VAVKKLNNKQLIAKDLKDILKVLFWRKYFTIKVLFLLS
jgi:hypothetical protein